MSSAFGRIERENSSENQLIATKLFIQCNRCVCPSIGSAYRADIQLMDNVLVGIGVYVRANTDAEPISNLESG